jgi:dynein heavy chain 2
VESKHNSPSVSTLPPCTVGWVPLDTPSPYPDGESIAIPVYSSSTHDKLVIQFEVPCGNINSGVVIQSGAAIFLKNL